LVRLDNMYVLSLENTSKFILLNLRCSFLIVSNYSGSSAITESFFKYLKKEELDRKVFKTIQEVTLSSFEYMEGFYNPKRPHSANNMLTPNQKERNYFESL
ncbi:IS3 family transposase, partial [Listeria seeligeri]